MSDRLLALARLLKRDPRNITELWSERAAIRQFDGNQSKSVAETAAYLDVCDWFGVRS